MAGAVPSSAKCALRLLRFRWDVFRGTISICRFYWACMLQYGDRRIFLHTVYNYPLTIKIIGLPLPPSDNTCTGLRADRSQAVRDGQCQAPSMLYSRTYINRAEGQRRQML